MCDVGPYTRVGRVADCEDCVLVSVIFEHSSSIWAKKKATVIINEGGMILRGITDLHFIDQRCQIDFKSTLCGKPSATPFSPTFVT